MKSDNPEIAADLVAEANNLDRGAGVDITDAPGDPTALAPEQGGPKLPTKQAIAPVFSLVFGFAADRAGDHWRLRDDEAVQLADATDNLLTHYFGNQELTPPLAFALIAGGIIGPRAVVQLAINAEEKANGEKSEPGKKESTQPVPGGDRERQIDGTAEKSVDETHAPGDVGPRTRSQDSPADPQLYGLSDSSSDAGESGAD